MEMNIKKKNKSHPRINCQKMLKKNYFASTFSKFTQNFSKK